MCLCEEALGREAPSWFPRWSDVALNDFFLQFWLKCLEPPDWYRLVGYGWDK